MPPPLSADSTMLSRSWQARRTQLPLRRRARSGPVARGPANIGTVTDTCKSAYIRLCAKPLRRRSSKARPRPEKTQSTATGLEDNNLGSSNRHRPRFDAPTTNFAARCLWADMRSAFFCCVSRCIHVAIGARFLTVEPKRTFFFPHKERSACTVGPGPRQSQLWHVGARVAERDPTALTMSRWPWRLVLNALTRFRGPERRRWQTYAMAARPSLTQVSSPLPLPKQNQTRALPASFARQLHALELRFPRTISIPLRRSLNSLGTLHTDFPDPHSIVTGPSKPWS
jgi:hypothetical protein